MSIAIEPADTLMQAHRIPRQVNVHEGGAAFLQVDSLASGFGRNEKTCPTTIELVSSDLARKRADLHQKRLQGSHFAHLRQAAANRLMIERRLDPRMSEVFSWQNLPHVHMKMMRSEHKPGNMAVLMQAPRTGLRTLEDVLEIGPR